MITKVAVGGKTTSVAAATANGGAEMAEARKSWTPRCPNSRLPADLASLLRLAAAVMEKEPVDAVPEIRVASDCMNMLRQVRMPHG